MIIAFDLDGTLCHTVDGEYADAKPFPERLEAVNRLYDAGHKIYIHTARGQSLSKDARDRLFARTRRQLEAWGVRYHALLEKPFAHLYVDDRAAGPMAFFEDPETTMRAAYLLGR